MARKVWHFLGVLFIAVCYHNMDRPMAIQVLTVMTALIVLADYSRLRSSSLNNIWLAILHPVMRDSERNKLSGVTFLMFGALIIVVFFPTKVVKLSLLFLALADPVASYFGIRYGKDRLFGRKSLQGTLAAFIVCCLVAMSFFLAHNLMTQRLLVVSILAGFAGALSEAVPVGKLDDNLVLPVLSSCMLWAIYYLFGGL